MDCWQNKMKNPLGKMCNQMILVFVASALLSCVLAQNPPLVVGPSLLQPLCTPRKWTGAASGSVFTSDLGRQDYFAFAGGDTNNGPGCADSLSSRIDQYVSTMGGTPKRLACGVGGLSLSQKRAYAAGVGVTFPPQGTAPRRTGYLIFAGGLVCSGDSRVPSDIIDILRMGDSKLLPPDPQIKLSSPRNYVAASSLCSWDRTLSSYKCLAFFAGGQGSKNACTAATPTTHAPTRPPLMRLCNIMPPISFSQYIFALTCPPLHLSRPSQLHRRHRRSRPQR